MRRIVIQGPLPGRRRSDRPACDQIVLLTNLLDVPAEIIALVYRHRWLIELFFRFLKHVLGCRRLLSEHPQGITLQVYCAILACLLLAEATGGSLNRRGYELGQPVPDGLGRGGRTHRRPGTTESRRSETATLIT